VGGGQKEKKGRASGMRGRGRERASIPLLPRGKSYDRLADREKKGSGRKKERRSNLIVLGEEERKEGFKFLLCERRHESPSSCARQGRWREGAVLPTVRGGGGGEGEGVHIQIKEKKLGMALFSVKKGFEFRQEGVRIVLRLCMMEGSRGRKALYTPRRETCFARHAGKLISGGKGTCALPRAEEEGGKKKKGTTIFSARERRSR